MWAGSHTDLLSGKSMFINMHYMDSPDESALCFTVYRHKLFKHKLSTTLGTPDPRKELLSDYNTYIS